MDNVHNCDICVSKQTSIITAGVLAEAVSREDLESKLPLTVLRNGGNIYEVERVASGHR
jgi:hypothetical protein